MGIFKTDEEKKQEHIKNGLAFADSNHYDKAVNEFESALKLFPKDEEALFNLGFVYADMLQFGTAYDIFKKLININPHHVEAFNNLGLLFARQEKYGDAIFVYEKGIEHNPDAAILFNNLGNVYYDTGKFEKALLMFKKAAELDPVFSERLYHLGIDSFIKDGGGVDDAIAILQKSVKQNVNKAKTVHDLGVAYVEHHMENKAIDSFIKALNIDPNYLSAYMNLGYIYQHKENYEKAVQAFEKAVILNPQSAKIYNTMGLIYDKMEKPDMAVRMYKKAVLLDPTYANTHYILGQLYQNRGSVDKAIAEFTKHIRIHETGNMVEDAMQRIAVMKFMTFEDVQKIFNLYTEQKTEGMSKQTESPFPPPLRVYDAPVMPVTISQSLFEVINNESDSRNVIDLPPKPDNSPWPLQNIPETRIEKTAADNEYKHIKDGPEKPAFDSVIFQDEPSDLDTITKHTDNDAASADRIPDFKKHPRQMPVIPVEPVHGTGISNISAISHIQPSMTVPLAPRHPMTPQGPHKIKPENGETPEFKFKKNEDDKKNKINRNYY